MLKENNWNNPLCLAFFILPNLFLIYIKISTFLLILTISLPWLHCIKHVFCVNCISLNFILCYILLYTIFYLPQPFSFYQTFSILLIIITTLTSIVHNYFYCFKELSYALSYVEINRSSHNLHTGFVLVSFSSSPILPKLHS